MEIRGVVDSKVILVGDASVGKTSIIQQFSKHIFDDDGIPDPTIGASFVSKLVETSSGSVQIHIWDTAGQERYRSLIPMYSRNAVAAIIVIDITSYVSFEHLDMWVSTVKTGCPPDCRMYIVANKIDLPPIVPMSDLEKWCIAHKYPLFRTSAKDYRSVAPMFERVAEDVAARVRPSGYSVAPVPNTDRDGAGCC
jgi:small GTP-binding protein